MGGEGRGGEGGVGGVYKTRTYTYKLLNCATPGTLTNLNLGGNGDTAVKSKCSSRLVLL